MKNHFKILAFTFIVSCFFSCQAKQKEAPLYAQNNIVNMEMDSLKNHTPIQREEVSTLLPFTVNIPSRTFDMPEVLTEISGLTYYPDSNFIATIQDERGKIYFIDPETGNIAYEFFFGKDGDYEGITFNDNTFYVTKSKGTIYEIKDFYNTVPTVKKYKTVIEKLNDVEGLCYDAKTHSLLLSCKGIPVLYNPEEFAGLSDEEKLRKSIYRFDLKSESLVKAPQYQIGLEQIQDFLRQQKNKSLVEQLDAYLKEDLTKFKLSTSGLAVHPQNGHIYILSSSKKLILVIDHDGNILDIAKLDKQIHRQPEGIIFDAKGNLYISNEGKDGVAKIYVFHPKK